MASAGYTYTVTFLLYVGWWLIPLLVLFVYRSRLMKYPVDCIIFEKRGENLVYSKDVAGRFEHPVTCYKLKNNKDSIPVPQYDWILQNMSKPTNFFEKIGAILSGKSGAITLFKYGSKQYKPIDVRVGDKVRRKFKEVRDKKGNPIYVTVYEPINAKREMSRLDFEVIDWDDINHMTQELRAIAQRRSPVKSFLERWGPTIGIAAVTLLFIIAIYYAYNLIIAAGDRYISASQQQAGYTPPPPPVDDGGVDTPLDGFLPS